MVSGVEGRGRGLRPNDPHIGMMHRENDRLSVYEWLVGWS
jgi:hypothetical protein